MPNENIIERKNTAELNQERAEEAETEKMKTFEKSGPNAGEYLIFLGIAIALDLSGMLSDLSLILAIPIRIITILPTLTFFLWRLWKGGRKVYPTGLALMGGAEAIFSFLPAYTCFVVFVWLKESKIGQSTIGKIPKLAKSKT